MLLVPSIVAVVLAACAAPGQGAGPGPGVEAGARREAKRVTVAILGEPYTLSQAVNSAGTGSIRGVGEVEKMIHAGLTMINGEGERVAQLAERAATVDNGLWKVLPDGRMETTWTLRRDARWHDGTPVTTDDLLFTARVAQDRDLAMPNLQAFKAITGIEAKDAQTIFVEWKKPFIEADQVFSSGAALPLPKHLLERTYLDDKDSLLSLPYWTTDFVGAGPFKVYEFVRGSQMIVRANGDYVLGQPKVDEIVVRFIQDPNTLIANVLAGEVDMTAGRGLNLEQALDVADRWDGTLESTPSNWIAHYPQHLTPDPAVIREAPFRRALLHAIDREALSESLQRGIAPVAHAFIGVSEPEYRHVEAQIVKYPYDQRRAISLIEQLGYTRGADSFFHDSSGKKLLVESRTNAGDDLKEKLMFAAADYWKQAGVDVTLVVVPRQRASDREYRATYPGFDLVRQPFDPIRFHSAESPLAENNWNGKNRTRYVNHEADELIDRYFTTIPLRERVDVLGRLVRVLTDQVAALGLIAGPEPTLIGRRLVNVAAGRAGADETWNVHLWEIRS